jgi:putative exosortase-associated protein (TIGR04073 family)
MGVERDFLRDFAKTRLQRRIICRYKELDMKLIICSLLLLAGFTAARADIQDPPIKKYDEHRKLSRGAANIAYGITEIPSTFRKVNEEEGNAAAFSLGILTGARRTLERFGVGVYEVATFHFAINKGTYKPILKSKTRGTHNAFDEFPPELGFDSSLTYVRR